MISKYKLYAGKYTNVNEKYTFKSGDSPYMLIFSCGKAPAGFTEIPLEKQKNLKQEEREWLWTVKLCINTAHVKNNQKLFKEYMQSFLERLDSELRRMEEKEQTEHGDKE